MDPTLAAIVTSLAVLSLVSFVAHWRATMRRMAGRHRDMAAERGLGPAEIKQLEHLARLVDDTTLADLLISPIRYNRATATYIRRLRVASVSRPKYFGIVLELTRLRRKVHPPGNMLRFLHSSRELPEGEEIVLIPAQGTLSRSVAVWAVNEDHIELRPADEAGLRGLEEGSAVTMELYRAGQGLYRIETTVRAAEAEPRPMIRLEHSTKIAIENRREHLRERTSTPVFVTPESESSPIQASLQDISGGGLAFIAADPMEAGTPAEVMVALGQSRERPVKARAVVLRTEQTPDLQWRHFCRWEEMPEDTREAIVRYVFSLQRRRIRGVAEG